MDYPNKLPAPAQQGFSAAPIVSARFLQMDDGGRRPMPRWPSMPMLYKLNFEYSWEQFAQFEAWWRYDLNMGAETFNLEVFPGFIEQVQAVGDYKASWSRSFWLVQLEVSAKQPPAQVPPKTSLPRWPEDLPELEQDSYKYTQFGAIHTSVKEGEKASRLRFHNNHADVSGKVILEAEQLRTFIAFFRDTLAQSLGWFSMPVAAGRGVRWARTSLLYFEITCIGSAYQVDLELTTFKMPRMSKLEYKYPNGLVFNEVLDFTESFGYTTTKNIIVHEVLFFAEQMSRRLIFNEQVGFTEAVKKHLRLQTIQDIITYIDRIRLSGGQNPSENLGFVENFNWKLTRRFAEAIQYMESVSIEKNYSRQIHELLSMLEHQALVFEAEKSTNDTAMFSEEGSIRLDTYASNYFAEDYTGVVRTF